MVQKICRIKWAKHYNTKNRGGEVTIQNTITIINLRKFRKVHWLNIQKIHVRLYNLMLSTNTINFRIS